MLEPADRYRRQAEEALAMMASETDPDARKVFAEIAEAWLSLAQRHIEKSDLGTVSGNSPPRAPVEHRNVTKAN